MPAGQIIQIGQTATAGKVYASNISFYNNSINHATNNTTGVVNLCNAQSDGNGLLNIGTHNSRAGPINIGTGFSSTSAINLGAITGTTSANTINIGILTPNAITIGHAAGNVTINSSAGSIRTPSITTGTLTASGLITANNGITLGSGKGIALSSVSYTPSNTQLGFTAQSTGAGWLLNTTPTGLCSYSNILIGTYFVSITLPLQNFTIGTGQIVTTSITATLNGVVGTVGGIVSIPTYPITTNLTGAVNCQMGETFIGFLKSTDNTCRLETIVSVNTGNVTALPPTMNVIRVA